MSHKTSHELARELLAGPDLPAWHFDPSRAGLDEERDTSLSVPKIEIQSATEGLTPEEIEGMEEEGCYTGRFVTICGDTSEEGEALHPRDGLVLELQKQIVGWSAECDKLRAGGIGMIAEERRRQIAVEGWTPEHDDEHNLSELLHAAVAYCMIAEAKYSDVKLPPCFRPKMWPWSPEAWKPSNDPVRNLVKAGALIGAEIDRLTREPQKVLDHGPAKLSN